MHYAGYVYPNEEVEWGLMIVMYPYITGIVAGAFIVASLYYVFKIEALAPVGKLSLLVSLAFFCCATSPLLLHLGHPMRSLLIMIRPNVRSAMAIFGYIYSFYMAVLLPVRQGVQYWLAGWSGELARNAPGPLHAVERNNRRAIVVQDGQGVSRMRPRVGQQGWNPGGDRGIHGTLRFAVHRLPDPTSLRGKGGA